MKKFVKQMVTLSLVICTLFTLAVPAFAADAKPVNIEEAWFPATTMNITQLAYETASHSNCNAIDLVSSNRLVAPFTAKVVHVDEAWGVVVLESVNEVRYSDGSIDYMSVCFMHSENIKDMVTAYKNGTIIKQGEAFYSQGGMGYSNKNAYGDHVDISIFRGKYPYPGRYGNGNVYAFDAFFINPAVTTRYEGRGEGYAVCSMSKGPADYRGKWKELDYMANCTLYPAKATSVRITKATTFKTLPCSKKTCSDSLNVRNGKMNETVQVYSLVKNTAGNYWYHVRVDNKEAYLFAGDCKTINSLPSDGLYTTPDGYNLFQYGKPVK